MGKITGGKEIKSRPRIEYMAEFMSASTKKCKVNSRFSMSCFFEKVATHIRANPIYFKVFKYENGRLVWGKA